MNSTPEQKEQWKQQRIKHAEIKHDYAKQYYQLNKESELERKQQWRKLNPDKVLEYNRRELIKQKERVICDVCGAGSTKHNLNRHKQSKTCIEHIKQNI